MADEFKPLNLAQIYQSADASVQQGLQSQMLVLNASRMKKEFDEEDAMRALAHRSTTYDETGKPSLDLKAMTAGAYSINPMKAIGFERAQGEAEKAAIERANLQGQVDERRMKMAADKLKVTNEASTVPFLEYQKLIAAGMPDADARAKVQPMYEAALKNIVTSGYFKPEELAGMKIFKSPQFDPDTSKAGMLQVLGAKDALAQYWEERKTGETERHNKSTEGETGRHNRATETQAAAALSQSQQQHLDGLRQQGLEVKQNEDGAWVVVNKNTKTAEPVRDPGTGEPLRSNTQGSEVERVAAGFASRMHAAEKILGGIPSADQKPGLAVSAAGSIPVVGSVIANELRGPAQQKALQAQQDWVRAKLRKESGAAIGVNEMADEIKMYFPQIGDSKAVIDQKEQSRNIATKAMVQAAGRSYKPETETPGGGGMMFATDAEATAAFKAGKIKKGDAITVNGVKGTWQ